MFEEKKVVEWGREIAMWGIGFEWGGWILTTGANRQFFRRRNVLPHANIPSTVVAIGYQPGMLALVDLNSNKSSI